MIKKILSIAAALLVTVTIATALTSCGSSKYSKKAYECPNKM